MRIGLLAPLLERIPPDGYGGTERVIGWLADELVRLGHDVDLFASGDCETLAHLVPLVPKALWPADVRDHVSVRLAAFASAYATADVDVMHSHVEAFAYSLARVAPFPTISTVHSRVDTPECRYVYERFGEQPLVAISEAQRRVLPGANWVATIPHGLPLDLYRPRLARGAYLAFVGRMAPEKGAHVAIEVARRSGLPLKIAGRPPIADWIGPDARAERDYFEAQVWPHLGAGGIEFVGELDDAGKQELYCGALALLFPVDWPEPFGIVLIEAMACGTPVIARPCGSVAEIVTDGVAGYLCETPDEMLAALERIGRIDRAACRLEFEARFTARRMAIDHVRAYEAVSSNVHAILSARSFAGG